MGILVHREISSGHSYTWFPSNKEYQSSSLDVLDTDHVDGDSGGHVIPEDATLHQDGSFSWYISHEQMEQTLRELRSMAW